MGVSLVPAPVRVQGDTPVGAIREIIRSIPCKAGMVADRRRLQCAQVAQTHVLAFSENPWESKIMHESSKG